MYKNCHIHFIGIGGIGMSGIAKILRQQGHIISGCDTDLEQKSIQDLKALGCFIYQDNNTPACESMPIDVLVYSSAIKSDNAEIVRAQKRGIPTIHRSLMLAELMRTKYSIAIAGAHGKTTTTALISHILIEAHKDPLVVIGGHLKNIATNARWGCGNFLVAEADESDRSLLQLYPTLAVVTNIDLEHLDIYKDLDDIKATFVQFLNNIPFYGKAIVCSDDPSIRSLLPLPSIDTITYGFNEQLADIYAQDIQLEKDYSTCTVYSKQQTQPLGSCTVSMPGRHNILNALAAIAVARDLDIDFDTITAALKSFKGIERRFSYNGTYEGAELFDDYGHHPTEIFNTLLVARKRATNKLIVIFQPQRYTRTHKLWHEFINVFADSSIDHLIITDIYPAGETPIENITSEKFVHTLQHKNPSCNVTYIPYDTAGQPITEFVKTNAHTGDLILFLGAGKINKLIDNLAQK